jgi:hypothetical protein
MASALRQQLGKPAMGRVPRSQYGIAAYLLRQAGKRQSMSAIDGHRRRATGRFNRFCSGVSMGILAEDNESKGPETIMIVVESIKRNWSTEFIPQPLRIRAAE